MIYIKNNLTFLCNKEMLSINKTENETGVSNLSRLIHGKIQAENLTLLTVIKLCSFFCISLELFVNQDIQITGYRPYQYSMLYISKLHVKDNLEYLYQETQITKYKIFKSTDISSHVLLKIMNGNINEKNLTIKTIVKLADYFNVSLDDFVFKDLSNQDSNETNKNCGK